MSRGLGECGRVEPLAGKVEPRGVAGTEELVLLLVEVDVAAGVRANDLQRLNLPVAEPAKEDRPHRLFGISGPGVNPLGDDGKLARAAVGGQDVQRGQSRELPGVPLEPQRLAESGRSQGDRRRAGRAAAEHGRGFGQEAAAVVGWASSS